MLSGVESIWSMAVQKTAQAVVMMTAAPAVSSAELNMQQRILSLSPAPKYFASGIPKPQHIPVQKPSTRNCTLDDAPTAARAFAPSTLPTMAESIML